MKKLAAVAISLFFVFGFAGTSAAENWLVRSKGNNVQTLWANGSVTSADATRGDPKTDHDQKENHCHSQKHETECEETRNLNEWQLIASGISSIESSFLTFRNPENQQEVVQVFYDRTGEETVTEVKEFTYSRIDGTRTEEVGTIDDYDVPTYTEGRVDQ